MNRYERSVIMHAYRLRLSYEKFDDAGDASRLSVVTHSDLMDLFKSLDYLPPPTLRRPFIDRTGIGPFSWMALVTTLVAWGVILVLLLDSLAGA